MVNKGEIKTGTLDNLPKECIDIIKRQKKIDLRKKTIRKEENLSR